MLDSMKTGQSSRNVIRPMGYELNVIKLGETSQGRCVCILSVCILTCLGDKDVSFLQVQGGHLSLEGLMTCFRDKGKGRSEKPSTIFYPFFLQLKISNRPRCHILGQCVLNPVNCMLKDSRPVFKCQCLNGTETEQQQLGALLRQQTTEFMKTLTVENDFEIEIFSALDSLE